MVPKIQKDISGTSRRSRKAFESGKDAKNLFIGDPSFPMKYCKAEIECGPFRSALGNHYSETAEQLEPPELLVEFWQIHQ
jgi:hypothetical protein